MGDLFENDKIPERDESLNGCRDMLFPRVSEGKKGTEQGAFEPTTTRSKVSGLPPRLSRNRLLGAVNKHPNCIKMKFEDDLTSVMVTRDLFGTATTTLFALSRQGNGGGVDGNHDVGGRG